MTESGSVETLNTTALNITLGGASPGHTYLITVYAVNGVGAGISTSGTCTVVPIIRVPSSEPISTDVIITKLAMATMITTGEVYSIHSVIVLFSCKMTMDDVFCSAYIIMVVHLLYALGCCIL